MLAVLTLARASMGVQFQSIAALGAPLSAEAGLTYAALGALIGAYLLPGVAAALAGGWLGATLGDIRTSLAGLALMTLGGVVGVLAEDHGVMFAARLVAGAGGVAINVMLTKMAADRFEAKELPAAMAVLVASWPAGIGLAMLILPPLERAFGLDAALGLPAALCALAAVLLAMAWRPPAGGAARAPAGAWPRGRMLADVALAGVVWGVYNAGFILLLAFGPQLLEAQGADPVAAAAALSLVTWLAIVSVVSGGWLGARTGRGPAIALGSFVFSAVFAGVIASGSGAPLTLAAAGLAVGFAAGIIMTLPALATPPATRALGMGVYFAVYYAAMTVAPPLGGLLRDEVGPAAPIWLAAAAFALCLPLFALCRARIARAASAPGDPELSAAAPPVRPAPPRP